MQYKGMSLPKIIIKYGNNQDTPNPHKVIYNEMEDSNLILVG